MQLLIELENNIPFDENNLTIEQNQIIKQEISNLFGLI